MCYLLPCAQRAARPGRMVRPRGLAAHRAEARMDAPPPSAERPVDPDLDLFFEYRRSGPRYRGGDDDRTPELEVRFDFFAVRRCTGTLPSFTGLYLRAPP